MRKILVSGCLFGWNCRYDGRAKPCAEPIFLKWKQEGRLIPVCPEVEGGLPTPRTPCQRNGDSIVSETGDDCTGEYLAGAEKALSVAKENDIVCCILKESSPSCGVNEIYDGTFSGKKTAGQGVTAELLRKNGFEIFSEDQLHLVEEFLQKHS